MNFSQCWTYSSCSSHEETIKRILLQSEERERERGGGGGGGDQIRWAVIKRTYHPFRRTFSWTRRFTTPDLLWFWRRTNLLKTRVASASRLFPHVYGAYHPLTLTQSWSTGTPRILNIADHLQTDQRKHLSLILPEPRKKRHQKPPTIALFPQCMSMSKNIMRVQAQGLQVELHGMQNIFGKDTNGTQRQHFPQPIYFSFLY